MDTHWNPDNAIYGDTPVKTSSADDCTSLYPNINAIIQSTNLYVYCGNNAVNRIDRTGMYWEELWEYYLQLLENAGGYFAVAAVATQIDSPAVGFADAAGLLMATIGVLAIGGIAILTYEPVSISMSIPKAKEEAEAETKDISLPAPNNQAYFPVDPYDFMPAGLYMIPFPGSGNGRILKWFDPITNIAVFEWDEDFKKGSHYHAMKIEWNGKHYGPHFAPGTPIPEPWNSIYF